MNKLDQHSFGPAPDRFKDNLAAALHKEEEPMKRKSFAAVLVAAILIVALAGTALAVAYWHNTTQQVAEMQAEHGYFETWSAADKAGLVLMLHENGALADDPRIDRLTVPGVLEQEKGELATAIMEEWIGNDEWFVTLDRVAEMLNGPFQSWTPEDKAWFTQTLRENGLLSSEDIVYEVPRTEDIDQATAIELAKTALISEYSLPDGYLDSFDINAMFYTPSWEVESIQPGDSTWGVEMMKLETEDGVQYHYVFMAEMDRHGNMLGVGRNQPKSLRADYDRMIDEKGAFYQWSMEDQATYAEALPGIVADRRAAGEEVDRVMVALSELRFGFPGADDMPKEEAVAIGKEYLKERYNLPEDGLRGLATYVSFDITNSENPLWRIKLLSSKGYVVHVNARTGEVVKSMSRSEDRIHAMDLF